MEIVYRLNEIEKAAQVFSDLLNHHPVMTFDGEMGAGKTTFILAVCRRLNASGSFGSPTFSIINEYSYNAKPVYHIDLYRCRDEEEAVRAGVEECLYSGDICLVEWPSRAPAIIPDSALRVRVSIEDDNTRKIEAVFPAGAQTTYHTGL